MDDLVSRQKVLQCIKESRENIDWGQSEDGDAFLHYSAALYRTIASKECLPSAERKKGRWKADNRYHYEKMFICSECRESVLVPTRSGLPIWDFCPNCGADMRGENNETD